eukprot:TRINITY_DN914_c1_g1_i1.p1 TRINITY_DN914_c1_g1~~TRINITY_DN914_c1_g1_i1.p1  ORF type:complete len:262 (+),score=23.80 TRINITY_DN914_c1_g1_i1:49-834(+)
MQTDFCESFYNYNLAWLFIYYQQISIHIIFRMNIFDCENAFSGLFKNEGKSQSFQTDCSYESSQGMEAQYPHDQQQVKVEESSQPDLEELERQLFGQGVCTRVMNWADEIEEEEMQHVSQSSDGDVHTSMDSFDAASVSLSGGSPRMECTSSLSSLARQLSSYSSFGVREGVNLTQHFSLNSSYTYSFDHQEEDEEGGEWIQVKNIKQAIIQKQEMQTTNVPQNIVNSDNQGKKKTRRRKRGGRRANRRSSAASSSTQEQK